MRNLFLIVLVLLTGQPAAHAQSNLIDSLKREVHVAVNDNDRLEALLALFEEGRNIHRDTFELYVQQAQALTARHGSRREQVLVQLALANLHLRWGWIDSSLAIAEPLLATLPVEDPAWRDLHFKVARQVAMYYGGRLKYSEALAVFYQLVTDAERYGDSIVVATNMNSIGSVALQRGTPETAISWMRRALLYNTGDARFEPVLAAIYTNLADAYTQVNRLDSALYYSKKGVELFSREQNLSNLAHALQRQSSLFIKRHELANAEDALKQMIEVRQRTNDGSMWLDDNLSLIDFYLETNQPQKAVDFCLDALQRGNVQDSTHAPGRVFSNNVNLRLSYYEALARSYKAMGQSQKYQETLEKIISAKDSFYLANSAEAIADVQTKYEVQKKENTIIQQKLALSRKNNLFYLTVASVLFLAIIAALLFTGYRKREKLKVQLMMERGRAEAERAVAEAEENERKRIAADLHDNLGVYAASIASNLDFIGTEGRGIAEVNALTELRNNSQSIVAQLADTIWALNRDALALTAISDRLKIFLQRLRPSYPQFSLELQEQIGDDPVFPPTQAYHLFRLIQEAVVNALKHSQGTRILILLRSMEGNWAVEIDDNGRGLPDIQPESRSGGNGLGNMKRRAADAGWTIEWIAAAMGGTRVRIEPEPTATAP